MASEGLEESLQTVLEPAFKALVTGEEYEAAEHKRRLDALGLAVELLEEGKPCPVCGSVEHPMTPDHLIQELKGIEKTIFRKLYAGKTASRMYHLYEYEKASR